MNKIATSSTNVKLIYTASQHQLNDETHANSGCGITCLWMVLKYLDPHFTLTLHDFNIQERSNSRHFDCVNKQWLQQGSAEYARSRGFKAMAVNLCAMGSSDSDLAAMYHSGRLSNAETEDYLKLFNEVQSIDDMKLRFEATIKFGLMRNSPVMIGVNPGHGNHSQRHRIICVGCDGENVQILDPLNNPVIIDKEPLGRLYEYMTGNLLLVYL